ncbi:MAG: transcription-repair coupling factor [Alphaproteobacteria bacterium]|nr:transcription-repair coupling factor [Alphaproteobacteria bacterium]MCW5739956.1 transcription-repair coupling factor [Alphaproteobacteria bacterium]
MVAIADIFARIHARAAHWRLFGAPEGADALLLSELARASGGTDILYVVRDGNRLERLEEALRFFAPGRAVLSFPAWDCLPYDRQSPHPDIVGERLDTLTRLASDKKPGTPARIVLASISAMLQRVPRRELYAGLGFDIVAGKPLDVAALQRFLGDNGYTRGETVMEPGEFAVRGGLIDLFPPGTAEPLRLDLFGDALESIRSFDPMSQRTTGTVSAITLRPVSEIVLTPDSIQRFRAGYRELFGAMGAGDDDPLYEAVSAGQRYPGMEHWLALFHDGLDTLFDYLPGAVVVLDQQAEEARASRLELIRDYYQARKAALGGGGKKGGFAGAAPYRPVPPERLYLHEKEWGDKLADRTVVAMSSFDASDTDGAATTIDLGGRRHAGFAEARKAQNVNLFEAVAEHIDRAHQASRRLLIAGYSEGSVERLRTLLRDHGVAAPTPVADYATAVNLPAGAVGMAVLPIENGFTLGALEVIGEEDILGDRLSRPKPRRRPSERFIAEAAALAEGDLIVHREHGIGRYEGLVAVEVGGARHDCLKLVYDGGDKLFVPVENIDVLSRYGASEGPVALDRLGGAGWQSRSARLKQRIADMADRLIKIAAERALKSGDAMAPPDGLYDEFCARFPYAETDDQLNAISDAIEDLGGGRPMDRLVCGDVGFGKTEVALRAAFVAAMSGRQVAVVAPTTLLARQHHRVFLERFAGFPVRIGRLSRLVPAKEATETRKGLKEGTVDIVIGTHALLGKSIEIPNLGLLIVDEEQHFGVAHKERLKELKADVHVLTLTATPIPRTLQLALTGVRDMSLIATPPVDRLAVRTFVTPVDPVAIREALLREQYRGGQSFYVCPRIEDLDGVAASLRELVPEIRFAMAHGRLAPTALEDTMQNFVDGKFDLLLSTNIVESGLDIRNANTLVIHRADMFGLSQLYQLRGRVGRAKTRAYCYLTVPPGRALNEAASKRLEVMQTLDTLGAGFQLASHDLDIRGAGNLLGEEQSGHIREVGIELYQQLLEEAVEAARGQAQEAQRRATDWSPQINLGLPVMIPETYVADLGVRMALYRRAADLRDQQEIDSFAAELVDRFGRMPAEVDNLLRTIALKTLCRAAGVEKIDAGPKGVLFAFRDNVFARPEKLIAYIQRNAPLLKVRPDQKVVLSRAWEEDAARLSGVSRVVGALAKMAA